MDFSNNVVTSPYFPCEVKLVAVQIIKSSVDANGNGLDENP